LVCAEICQAGGIARAKKPYAITLLSALLFGALALVLLNTILADLPLGRLERYLRFSESWGTDRGKIWAFVLRVYEQLPPIQKLFGASSGGLFHADSIKPIFRTRRWTRRTTVSAIS
jgi:hypothetical protein